VAVLATLVVYNLALVAIGLFARRMASDAGDYFLGGRRLGPWVAALSASASSSSVWTLVGVSGYAYAFGYSAVWIFPACVGGFCLNWFLVAPALRRESLAGGALTMIELLAGPPGTPRRRAIVVTASVIVLGSLVGYIAAQFHGAGEAIERTFDLPFEASVLIGGGVVIFYTFAGGFWAVSLTDTLQGLLMAVAAVVLPAAALCAAGGPAGLWEAAAAVSTPGWTSPWRDLPGAAALGLVLGLLGIGLGYPGQPHVVNWLMALRDEDALRRGRRIAIVWAVILYSGMITLGLCARVVVPGLTDHEDALVASAHALMHPVLAGVMIAAVLSAIMSTADSQLLVATSTVSHDLARAPAGDSARGLGRARLTALAISAVALLVALYATTEIFGSVLFAWSAMGAAFGPVLLVTVLRGRLDSTRVITCMLAGSLLSVAAYAIPETRGTALERVLPWAIALAVAAWPSARTHLRQD
jgi:sodium/proline symporter